MRQKERAPIEVVIVAKNPETLEGLRAYLQGTGIASEGSGRLGTAMRLASRASVAIVIFPDDFPEREVRELAGAPRSSPGVLSVVVTGKPRRFEGIERCVVLPRSSFGWEILDAIRAHASSSS